MAYIKKICRKAVQISDANLEILYIHQNGKIKNPTLCFSRKLVMWDAEDESSKVTMVDVVLFMAYIPHTLKPHL